MPPVPKKKHTRGQTKRGARARISLPTLSKCPECGKLKEPHKACPYCGYYR